MLNWRRRLFLDSEAVLEKDDLPDVGAMTYMRGGVEVDFYNMLCFKPMNDIKEFYKAIERIQDEMARHPHTP